MLGLSHLETLELYLEMVAGIGQKPNHVVAHFGGRGGGQCTEADV